MSKTQLQAWSALAVVGVLVMLGASVASAAPTLKATDPTASARVTITVTPTIIVRKDPNGQEVTLGTVTVTPTILVSRNANGELVTVGTVMPGAKPAATPGASSGGVLAWIVVGLALLLAAGGAYWWIIVRRSTDQTPLAGRRAAPARARVTPPPSDTPPEERPEH